MTGTTGARSKGKGVCKREQGTREDGAGRGRWQGTSREQGTMGWAIRK